MQHFYYKKSELFYKWKNEIKNVKRQIESSKSHLCIFVTSVLFGEWS